jgi:hypothetical protein
VIESLKFRLKLFGRRVLSWIGSSGDVTLYEHIEKLEIAVNRVRNESLSYFTFNGQRIDRLRSEIWEGNQHLLERNFVPEVLGSRRINVVFFVADTSLWDVFAPIHHLMSLQPWALVRVIAFARIDVRSDKAAQDVLAFFEERGIEASVEGYYGDLSAVTPANVDLAFYTLGSTAYPERYRIEYLSTFCRTCYLSYGFLLVNEEDYQFNQDFHHAAWTIFASTEREKSLYEKNSRRRGAHVLLTGYPKFDLLDARRNPVSKPTRPIVIWAPHWTVGDVYERLKFGLFERFMEAFEAFMARRQDIDFVFKPHPNLLYGMERLGKADAYAAFMSRMGNATNVCVLVHGDYCDLFLRSSAMITESVSFIAEYLPTGNPLLYLERDDRTTMSDVGESLVSLHYRGRNMVDVENFIGMVIDRREDDMCAQRLNKGYALLGIGEQTATEKICAHVASSFGHVIDSRAT